MREIKENINKWIYSTCSKIRRLSIIKVLFSCLVMSNSLLPHELQHTRTSCPSPSPKVCSVMLLCHLILWLPLLLLPSIFPTIRDFSNESALCIRWTKYWGFSFSISPSNEYSGLISLKIDWFYLQSKGLSEVFSTTIVQSHQFFGTLTSLWSKSHNRT